MRHCLLSLLLVVLGVFVYAQETNYQSADLWNFPSDNYWVCATLKTGSAHLRYSDGSLQDSTSNAYDVNSSFISSQCGSGWARLDYREIVYVRNANGDIVMRLAWHKGGQDYNSPQPAYGYLSFDDIATFDGIPAVTGQWDNCPLRGKPHAGEPQVVGQPLEYGSPSWDSSIPIWDWTHRNGVGIEPTDPTMYTVKVIPQGSTNELSQTWQYKPGTTSSNYDKYADGGAEYGSHKVHYAWLVWSWLFRGDGVTKNGGGGQMRSCLRNGQEFYRCPVKSIPSLAYAYNSSTITGEVTAWYVKTRTKSNGNIGPWIYGWMIASHRVKNSNGTYGPYINHFDIEQQTSISTISENDVKISPNPLNGNNKISIDFGDNKIGNATIEFIDLKGKIIYKKKITNLENTLTINALDLNRSIYLVKITTLGNVVCRKLIIN
jgi:hypothetical protein